MSCITALAGATGVGTSGLVATRRGAGLVAPVAVSCVSSLPASPGGVCLFAVDRDVSISPETGEVLVWDVNGGPARRRADGRWVFGLDAVPTADELKDD
jgi:hypothetical protein